MAFIDEVSSETEYQEQQAALINSFVEQPSEQEEELIIPQEENEEENFEEEEGEDEQETVVNTVDEDILKRQIEKDLKKKYLSQVSIKAKEADRYKQELDLMKQSFDPESLTTVEKVVEAKMYEKELARLAEVEYKNFLKANPDAKNVMEWVKEIKDDFPSMSWERAYKNYLIDNDLPIVTNTKTNTTSSLHWSIPSKVANPPKFDWMTENEQRQRAMAEMNRMLWN